MDRGNTRSCASASAWTCTRSVRQATMCICDSYYKSKSTESVVWGWVRIGRVRSSLEGMEPTIRLCGGARTRRCAGRRLLHLLDRQECHSSILYRLTWQRHVWMIDALGRSIQQHTCLYPLDPRLPRIPSPTSSRIPRRITHQVIAATIIPVQLNLCPKAADSSIETARNTAPLNASVPF